MRRTGMRRDRRRRLLRRLRYRARTRCDASDPDGTEPFDRSVGANDSYRAVGEGQQSRPPRRRDCRDAAHTEE